MSDVQNSPPAIRPPIFMVFDDEDHQALRPGAPPDEKTAPRNPEPEPARN